MIMQSNSSARTFYVLGLSFLYFTHDYRTPYVRNNHQMQGTLKQIQDYSQRSDKLKSSITEGEKEKEDVKKSKEASALAMKESQKVT